MLSKRIGGALWLPVPWLRSKTPTMLPWVRTRRWTLRTRWWLIGRLIALLVPLLWRRPETEKGGLVQPFFFPPATRWGCTVLSALGGVGLIPWPRSWAGICAAVTAWDPCLVPLDSIPKRHPLHGTPSVVEKQHGMGVGLPVREAVWVEHRTF